MGLSPTRLLHDSTESGPVFRRKADQQGGCLTLKSSTLRGSRDPSAEPTKPPLGRPGEGRGPIGEVRRGGDAASSAGVVPAKAGTQPFGRCREQVWTTPLGLTLNFHHPH
jgi:hypothetical protein